MKPILLFLFGILLAGCELLQIPIDVEPAPEQLVISSVRGPAGLFLVTVSRSFSALSTSDLDSITSNAVDRILVDQARVELWNSSQRDTLVQIEDVNGLYFGQSDDFDVGDSLYLNVYDSLTSYHISASTPVLESVEIDTVTYSLNVENQDSTKVLEVIFPDLVGPSFFVLHVYQTVQAADSTEEFSLFLSDSNVLLSEQLISDLTLDSTHFRRRIEYTSDVASDTVLVSLSHISEGYFRFLDARKRTGGLLASAANEPINFPTNIKGGQGYFSAHIPNIRSAILRKELIE